MAESNSQSKTDTVVEQAETASALAEEVETKGLYIATAGLYLLNEAGVFSGDIPAYVFAVVFGAAVFIDAYN